MAALNLDETALKPSKAYSAGKAVNTAVGNAVTGAGKAVGDFYDNTLRQPLHETTASLVNQPKAVIGAVKSFGGIANDVGGGIADFAKGVAGLDNQAPKSGSQSPLQLDSSMAALKQVAPTVAQASESAMRLNTPKGDSGSRMNTVDAARVPTQPVGIGNSRVPVRSEANDAGLPPGVTEFKPRYSDSNGLFNHLSGAQTNPLDLPVNFDPNRVPGGLFGMFPLLMAAQSALIPYVAAKKQAAANAKAAAGQQEFNRQLRLDDATIAEKAQSAAMASKKFEHQLQLDDAEAKNKRQELGLKIATLGLANQRFEEVDKKRLSQPIVRMQDIYGFDENSGRSYVSEQRPVAIDPATGRVIGVGDTESPDVMQQQLFDEVK